VDANGRRRYVSGKTKPEVRQKLRRLLADGDQGIAYDSENLTVEAYLDRWLEAIEGSVRDRTWERHEQVVRLHLKPRRSAAGGSTGWTPCKRRPCTGANSKPGSRRVPCR
jgi:hypothetical protein